MVFGDNPKRENYSSMEESILSTSWIDEKVPAVIFGFIEEENCYVHGRKNYANVYGKLMEAAMSHTIGSVADSVKLRRSDEVGVEGDELNCSLTISGKGNVESYY